jgi:hypothetical protein
MVASACDQALLADRFQEARGGAVVEKLWRLFLYMLKAHTRLGTHSLSQKMTLAAMWIADMKV